MTAKNYENDWLSPLLKLISDFFIFTVFGLFILCQWLTGKFILHVLNPIFNYVFDRNDGLVVLTSIIVWMLIGWSCVPLLVQYGAHPAATWSIFWQMSLVCLGWGTAIGGWLILNWWTEAETGAQPPTFAEVTGLPRNFYDSSTNNGNQHLAEPSDDELEGVLLGVEWQERQR